MKHVLKIAAAAAACMAAAAPVAAQESASRTVRYGDLDLRTESGAAALSRRIERAGRSICGEPADRSLFELNAVRSCLEQVARSAAGPRAGALAAAREARVRG
jgi:UrcA family protein